MTGLPYVGIRRILAVLILAIVMAIVAGAFLLGGGSSACGAWPSTSESPASLLDRMRDLSDAPTGTRFELRATSVELAGALVARMSRSSQSPLGGIRISLRPGELTLDTCLRDIFLGPTGLHGTLTLGAMAGTVQCSCTELSIGRLSLPTWVRAIVSRRINAWLRQAGSRLAIEWLEITPDCLLISGRIAG